MKTYGGGFTENFYGLKRERVLRVKDGEVPRAALGAPEQVRETLRLRDSDIWKNLAVMVALPYVKRKLDESYDIHAAHANVLGPTFGDGDQLAQDATIRQRVMHYYKWFLRKVYPSVNAAYYFSLLAFNLAYLFDGSKYHSPFLFLIGTRMRRLNRADHQAIDLATQPPAPRPGARPGQTSIFSPQTLTHTVYPRLLSSLKILLPTSIFALKFLEWWHASDFARQLTRKAAEGLDLPPPTISGLPPSTSSQTRKTVETTSSGVTFDEKSQRAETDITTTTKPSRPDPPISNTSSLPILTVPPAYSSELCAICLAPIQTPTAAQTGYVYCYTCIFKWVEGTHTRQEAFMEGRESEGAEQWAENVCAEEKGNREGRWESGKGRDAITGRRILGGTSGLRRVMV